MARRKGILKNLDNGRNKSLTNKRRSLIPEGVRRQLGKFESADMTEAIIASLGEGLIILDEYGHINRINETALDMLGFERREIEGQFGPRVVVIKDKSGNVLPTDSRPAFRALLTGQAVSDVVYVVRADGVEFPLAITATPFVVNGRPKGVILLYRDVTQEMQIERAKDEFVSIASHQLRSPLTSIRLFGELLLNSSKGKLNDKELRYISQILFSTEKMIDLVTDFLNVSRLELGQLGVKTQPTDLNELIKIRLEEISPVAQSANVRIIFDNRLAKAEKVPIDRDLLGQVVNNLLTNAIRYTQSVKRRRPTVRVTLKKGRRYLEITVADNGIGIPRTARLKIFERFYRAENAVIADTDGTGLGLYLVKQIIESTGGKISLKSKENQGSTFTVCIPVGGMGTEPKI